MGLDIIRKAILIGFFPLVLAIFAFQTIQDRKEQQIKLAPYYEELDDFVNLRFEDIRSMIVEKNKSYEILPKEDRQLVDMSDEDKKELLQLLQQEQTGYSRPRSRGDRRFYIAIDTSDRVYEINMYVRDYNSMMVEFGLQRYKSRSVFRWLIEKEYMTRATTDHID